MPTTYKDLIVWQKPMDLVEEIYSLTKNFPKEEQFGLVSQLRRAAVSIPSNIAEGRYRTTNKDCKQFFTIGFGSGAEVETQLQIALRLGYLREEGYHRAASLLSEVMKMLNVLIKQLSNT
jgi:four helix bundle protein